VPMCTNTVLYNLATHVRSYAFERAPFKTFRDGGNADRPVSANGDKAF